jgi:3-phosphoshikimate 1-carboxyvinyltransferase
MHTLTLEPCVQLSGEITLPGSKSISNRALLLAALANGSTRIHNLLDSEDTRLMREALSQLEIALEEADGICTVHGCNGPLYQGNGRFNLDLGLAGTAIRPLTAALTLGQGQFVLDGIERMRERPIGPLVDGLRQLGASIRYLQADGFPPVEIYGGGLRGGHVRIPGDLSSQFLTSLLMAAPLAAGPVTIEVTGEQISKPYLEITVHMMQQFGVTVSHDDFQYFTINPQRYQSPGDFLVEGDASSASYFLAAGAIRGDGITVHGLGADSVQGDLAFVDVLEAMGAQVTRSKTNIAVKPGSLVGVDLDLNHIPDAAMTVAMLALFATGTTTLRNIYSWRVKETDRLAAMSTELRKLGATVIEGRDFIQITPPAQLTSATIDTYGDHRMAMCFSLACLGGSPITIADPDCVEKTFPDYFERFAELRCDDSTAAVT